MNKQKIDLENDKILRSENVEYNNQVLKDYLDNGTVYSNEEQKIGKWKNGKTLYRKVLTTAGLPGNTKKSLEYNIANLDEIWIENGFIKSAQRVTTLPMVGYNGDLSQKVDVWIERSENVVKLYSNGGWGASDWTFEVILNYTKTTD